MASFSNKKETGSVRTKANKAWKHLNSAKPGKELFPGIDDVLREEDLKLASLHNARSSLIKSDDSELLSLAGMGQEEKAKIIEDDRLRKAQSKGINKKKAEVRAERKEEFLSTSNKMSKTRSNRIQEDRRNKNKFLLSEISDRPVFESPKSSIRFLNYYELGFQDPSKVKKVTTSGKVKHWIESSDFRELPKRSSAKLTDAQKRIRDKEKAQEKRSKKEEKSLIVAPPSPCYDYDADVTMNAGIKVFNLLINGEWSGAKLKRKLSPILDVKNHNLRLFYKKREIDNSTQLGSRGIKSGDTIFIKRRLLRTEAGADGPGISADDYAKTMKHLKFFSSNLGSFQNFGAFHVDSILRSWDGARIPLRIVVFMYSLLVSDSLSNDYALISGWLLATEEPVTSALFLSGLATMLGSWRHYKPSVPDTLKTESLSEGVRKMADEYKLIIGSDALSALRDIVLYMTSFHFFEKDVSDKIRRYLGKPKPASFTDAVSMVLDSIATLLSVGERLAAGEKLNSVLLSSNPLLEAVNKFSLLKCYKDKIYFGLPVEGWKCAREYCSELIPIRDTLMLYRDKVSTFSNDARTIHSTLPQVLECISIAESTFSRKVRPAPAVVVIHGSPGIGKAGLLNFVAKIHSEVKGRRFESSHVFERVTSSDYWDGYNPSSTPYVHYSELGNTSVNLVRTKGDPVIAELTSVVDNAPMSLNMSSVEDKGRVYCAPELVLIDTNNPNMNLDSLVSNPSAYRRRFLYIEPVVKQEFRKKNSLAIDPTIPSDDPYDKWTFDVYRLDPKSHYESFQVDYMKKTDDSSDIYKLAVTLRDHFRNHIEEQERQMKRIDNLKAEDYLEGRDFGISSMMEEKEDYPDMRTEAFTPEDPIDGSVWGNLVSYMYCKLWCGLLRLNRGHYDACKNVVSEIRKHTFLIWNILYYVFCVTFIAFNLIAIGMVRLIKAHLPTLDFNFLRIVCAIFFIRYSYHSMISWLLLVACLSFDWKELAKKESNAFLQKQKDHYYSCLRYHVDYAAWFYFGKPMRAIFSSPHLYKKVLVYSSLTVGVLALLKGVVSFLKKSSLKSEVSEFKIEVPINEAFAREEERLNCGRSYKRVNVHNSQIWNTVITNPSTHKGDVASLARCIRRNSRPCFVNVDGVRLTTYVLGIKGNYALINRHSLGKLDSPVTVSVATSNSVGTPTRDTIVKSTSIVMVGDDIALVQLNGIMFADIVIHFPVDDKTFRYAEGMISEDDVVVQRSSTPQTASDDRLGSVTINKLVSYAWDKHKPGMCGLPVVAQRDTGVCIVGLHAFGDAASHICYAEVVLRGDINSKMDQLKAESGYLFEVYSTPDIILGGELPKEKSPFRFEDLRGLDYFGSTGESVHVNQKSKLQRSKLASLEDVFQDHAGYVQKVKYMPPVMKPMMRHGEYISPYNIALRKMSVQKKTLDSDILLKCVDDFSRHIISGLEAEGVTQLRPLELLTAINGVKHDPFIRRVHMGKAAGYGTPGKKSVYFERYDDEAGRPIDEPNEAVKIEILSLISTYQSHRAAGHYYKAQLKDEPRDVEKVKLGKTRVFYSSPLAPLLVQRMFLAPMYSLLVEHSDLFCTAIGIDMHRDAHGFRERLLEFSTNIIEGDYGGYDTSMPVEIGYAVNEIVVRVLSHFGYSEAALDIVRGLLTDNIFPFVVMLEDVFCSPGLQPSGKAYTAEDNSLRNVMILLYAWNLDPDLATKDFFQYVKPATYGDDLLAAVKDDVKQAFNGTRMQYVCEEHLGMEFTTADKSSVVPPFVNVDDMSFLKRNFVWKDDLDRYVAPLSMDSIYKSLEWVLPSDNVNEPMQMEQTLSSAMRELFFHLDCEKFEVMRKLLMQDMISAYGVDEKTLNSHIPTYDQLKAELSPLQTEAGEWHPWDDFALGEHDPMLCLDCILDTESLIAFGRAIKVEQWPADNVVIFNTISSLRAEEKELDRKLSTLSHPCPGKSYHEAQCSYSYSSNLLFRDSVDEYYYTGARLTSVRLTILRLEKTLDRRSSRRLITESGVVGVMETGDVKSDVIEINETVIDIQGRAEDSFDAGSSKREYLGQDSSLKIGDFFSRPIILGTHSLMLDTDIDLVIPVWELYFNSPSVRAKLKNFAFVKGDLNVRITVSGTPFHYGKLMCSYQPFHTYNSSLQAVLTTYPVRPAKLVYLSQARAVKNIDVKANKPVELHIPYVSPQPIIKCFNYSPLVLTDAMPLEDVRTLGALYISSLNRIKAITTTASKVDLTITCWMSDVELGCPTGTLMELTTESGKADERIVGPIETIASSAYNISKKLEEVPIISPYAKASSSVFKAAEELSALFGFSVPPMINEPIKIKQEPLQNGAQVIGYDTGKMLSLDPKIELNVDPRVTGSGEDEMSLRTISKRESLLAQVMWSPTDNTLVPFWTTLVTPMNMGKYSLGAADLYAPTSVAYVAALFKYWRGIMKYRIEIVVSGQHRGKLAIFFEPNVSQSGSINATLQTNKQHMMLIDIQETQDIEFCVDWASSKAWLKNMPYTSNGAGFPEDAFKYANGYIGFAPFTSLQSPDDSSVSINVYVSSEDVLFNRMTVTNMPTQRLVVESGVAAETTSCMILNPTGSSMEGITNDYFGEVPTSFRSLLKRFTTSARVVATGSLVHGLTGTFPIWPSPLPSFTQSLSITPTLLGYLRLAYVGMRGSLRKRLFMYGDSGGGWNSIVRISLLPESTSEPPATFVTGITPNEMVSTLDGSVSFALGCHQYPEFTIPHYSRDLFLISFNNNNVAPAPMQEQEFTRGYRYVGKHQVGTALPTMIEETATGEDFSFFYYQGAPCFVAVASP